MDFIELILGELLYILFPDIMESKKIPKVVKDLLVCLVGSFVIYIGVIAGLNSIYIWGNILGFAVAIFGLVSIIFSIRKIHKK